MATKTNHKFKEALRYQLINYENKSPRNGKIVERGQALKAIAKNLIHIAINSKSDQLQAIKELADRLDGKPTQAISGPEGDPITVVQRVIVQHAAESPRVIDVESVPITPEKTLESD